VDQQHRTDSGIEIHPLYGPQSTGDLELGSPGEYPFTRGVYPGMYRDRLWTMRQYAGFGSAEATNERFRYLLTAGQTGLSVAFDLPTQMGYDSDHPKAQAEVGRVGVAIDSLADMELLFDQIPLGEVSTSMTINATASILLLLYELVAEKQGVAADKIGGTTQNDILKEYTARGTYIYPPRPSMRIITDLFAYCHDRLPRWNTISISGYHMREAGSTAVQEVAFTIADGIAYAQAAVDAGLDVDDFAPRLSFFFACHMNFFEEVAKFRPSVGHRHEGTLRGEEPEVDDAPLPHADRGSDADRATAREQHRSHRLRSDGRGARRYPVAAHERFRRSTRASESEGRHDRTPHPAGPRIRDRDSGRGRSPRGQLLR
jgi:methylmalonyl-CoA mutase N-terminal domain/subunit